MRRPIPSTWARLCVVVALCACASPVEPARVAAGVTGGAWVLRRIDGAVLPARVHASAEGFAEVLADTLRFDRAVVHASGATRVVGQGAAPAQDTVYASRLSRSWRVADGEVRIGDGPCGGPGALMLCAAPDTGRVRGDTLVLAAEHPGAARRAYVRVAP